METIESQGDRMSGRRIRRLFFVAGGVILAAGLALAYVKYAPRRTPVGQPPLAAIRNGDLTPFTRAFDAGAGSTRVVLMLSPT